MALLGQLTVGILGDMSGYSNSLSAAQKETVKFSKKMEQTGRNISTIGYGFQDIGSKLTKSITAPVLTATTAIAGMTAALGWKRLVGLDTAQAQLKGLGYNTEEVGRISEQVTNAIDGGMTTMAEGTSIAAGALAAGVDEGKELERYIKLVGDAAVGANRPVADMAQIFNRVQGQGKLMTMELNMIEQGMPGFAQAMADSLADGSLESFREMVTNGEVGSKEFLDVMDDFAGGMAGAYSESWAGMTKNTLAYIGIIGENILEGVFQKSKGEIAKFIEVLKSDAVMNWAKKTGEAINNAFEAVGEKIRSIKQWYDDLSPSMQELTKKIALFGSIGAVAIGPVLLIIGKLIVTVGTLVTRFGAIMGAVTKLGGVFGILTGPIGIVIGVIAALIAIGVLLYKNWDTVKEKAQTVFTSFAPLLEVVKGAFQNLFSSVSPIMDSLKNLWQSLIPLLQTVGTIIAAIVVPAFGILVSVFSAVIAAIGPFVEAIINFVDVVVNIVNALIALFTGDFTGALEFWKQASESTIEFVKNLWETVVQFFVTFVETIIEFFHNLYMTLVGNSIIPDMVNAIVEWFQNMFQWVIDIVMMIVEGITEAFMTIYETVSNYIEMVSEIILSVWDFIKDTFANALAFILALVTGDFQGMKDAIQAQMDNAKNLLMNIWKAIDKFLSKTLGGIWDTVKSIFSKIFSTISSILNKVRSTVTSIWNGIRSVISSVLNGIRSVVTSVWNGIRSTISSVMNGIRSVISSIWNGIKSTISSVVNGIKSTVTSTFNSIKSSATRVFNGVKSAMTKPVETAKNTIKRSIDAVKGFFSGLKLKFPKISMPKLPKFTLKGKFSLTPPSVPKVGISWNALGGIFKRPTIFNTANAGLQGVGEAGAEAIIPLNNKTLGTLGEMIGKTMPGNNDNLEGILIEQNNILKQLLKKDTSVYVDTDSLYNQFDNRLAADMSLESYKKGQR